MDVFLSKITIFTVTPNYLIFTVLLVGCDCNFIQHMLNSWNIFGTFCIYFGETRKWCWTLGVTECCKHRKSLCVELEYNNKMWQIKVNIEIAINSM